MTQSVCQSELNLLKENASTYVQANQWTWNLALVHNAPFYQFSLDNHNFRKYSHGEADYYGEGYDFDSVMHYGNWDFSVNNQMTIEAISNRNKILGQRDGFSQTDVKQLNKVYKCKGYENVKVPPLKGIC